ncbi:cell cycle checkpoint protein RAD17 [Phlebotomus argentipes]|uniref:cell cycle checkpoint protein RAD17 n=1 Tax=Phlebotomus argentipes TaxID=94469 RepID=UPI002892E3E8|nr:cell cycle checkpoint protein RAD17 [Phlebotomus argentipes]
MSKTSSGAITLALRDIQSGRNVSEGVKKTSRISRKRSSCDGEESVDVSAPKKSLSEDWLKIFAPKKVEELAVHPNKIQDVKQWLESYEKNAVRKRNPIVLLTGPAGCGKTATVKCLAEEKVYELCEWVTPVDSCKQFRNADDEGMQIEESQAEKFREFLFKASRYKSLFAKTNKRMLLVEDFPNYILRDHQMFTDLLKSWEIYGRCPLVFVVTETKSKKLNLSFNLFPDSLKSQFNIQHISFNPISVTLMKKALQRITKALNHEPYSQVYKQSSQEVVDSLITSAMGDIRNAILNLQFVSQKDAKVKINIEQQGSRKKGKGKSSGANKRLKTVGRDETITLMHALGRVFNPKYENSKLSHNPEKLCDDFETQPHNFLAFLHANYLQHVSSLNDCSSIAENLSFSEFLSREWRSDEIPVTALLVAIRGTMALNAKPSTGWIPTKGPRKLPQISSHEQHEEIFRLGYEGFHSIETAATDLIQYAKMIGKEEEKRENCDET